MQDNDSNKNVSSRLKELTELNNENTPFLVTEIWDLVKLNKSWWLMPILLAMLLFGALVLLSGTSAAPFIYTLF